jgi:hypothetical protein
MLADVYKGGVRQSLKSPAELLPPPSIAHWEAERTAPNLVHPLGEPLPGRQHPVKAISREAGARCAPALSG